MKRAEPISIAALRAPLLRSVSRSFYLSIRVLPMALRDPIALAYLLARATDTIADTAQIPAATRQEQLRVLAAVIQGEPAPNELEDLRRAVMLLQQNPAERALINGLPDIVRWLAQIAENDRTDIRAVLGKINRGQALDVARFPDNGEVKALVTAADLDEYTYLVAGCVGEFWTRICFRHLPRAADRTEAEMIELGVRYGKGLQLINILRDLGSDLRNGRCYLPEEELRQLGLAPNDLAARSSRLHPIFERWRQQAEADLVAGMDYACALTSTRVRIATALPALIGARTLALLRVTGTESLETRVKASRSEVRSILLRTFATRAHPRTIRKMFARLSR